MVFGHLIIIISTDFYGFISVSSLVLVLIEKTYQTLKTVISKASNFVNNAPLHVIFSTLFLVFGSVVRHGLFKEWTMSSVHPSNSGCTWIVGRARR